MAPLMQWALAIVVILVCWKLVSMCLDPELIQAVQDWWADDTESWWDRASTTGPGVPLCCMCHRPAVQPCATCQSAKYCSTACQKEHWKRGHKSECLELRKARQAAEEPGTQGIRPPLHSIFPYEDFLALLTDSSLARRLPVGLDNCGNSCYANAVLQCLLATPPLATYLHLRRHKTRCIAPLNSWCALCALEDLAAQMFDPEQNVASAKGFMQHIKKLGKDFAIGRQEDSHEFLVQLLEAVETIMLRERGDWADLDARSKETTLVHHIFGSYLRSECICSVCNHSSRSYECTTTLEVQVPNDGNSLEAALERFCAEDILDGDNMYECQRCQQLVRAYRSTRIEVAPNVLQICLKRYRHMPGRFQSKNNAKVAYDEKLDLAPYMATLPLDSHGVKYTLYGVVVHLDHMNSTTFGHYVSFVRTSDGRWFDCDDTQVTQVTKNAVLERNAYMLFYLRDEPRSTLASLCEAYREVRASAALANREALAADRLSTSSTEGWEGKATAPGSMMHRIMTSPAALEHMAQGEGVPSRFYQSVQSGSYLQLPFSREELGPDQRPGTSLGSPPRAPLYRPQEAPRSGPGTVLGSPLYHRSPFSSGRTSPEANGPPWPVPVGAPTPSHAGPLDLHAAVSSFALPITSASMQAALRDDKGGASPDPCGEMQYSGAGTAVHYGSTAPYSSHTGDPATQTHLPEFAFAGSSMPSLGGMGVPSDRVSTGQAIGTADAGNVGNGWHGAIQGQEQVASASKKRRFTQAQSPEYVEARGRALANGCSEYGAEACESSEGSRDAGASASWQQASGTVRYSADADEGEGGASWAGDRDANGNGAPAWNRHVSREADGNEGSLGLGVSQSLSQTPKASQERLGLAPQGSKKGVSLHRRRPPSKPESRHL